MFLTSSLVLLSPIMKSISGVVDHTKMHTYWMESLYRILWLVPEWGFSFRLMQSRMSKLLPADIMPNSVRQLLVLLTLELKREGIRIMAPFLIKMIIYLANLL